MDDFKLPENHAERVNAARSFAQYYLGDPTWANQILFAYMNPEAAEKSLEADMAQFDR